MSWSVFVLCSQCPAEECSPTATTGDNPLQEVSQGISNLPVIQTALQCVYSTVRSKSHLLILRFCIDKTTSSYHGRGDNCWVLTDGWRKEPVWCDVGSTSIEVFLLNRAPGKELTTFPLHCHVTWWSEHPLRWRCVRCLAHTWQACFQQPACTLVSQFTATRAGDFATEFGLNVVQ